MKSKCKKAVRTLGRALLVIVCIGSSHAVLRAEGATYHQYIWSGGQSAFAGVLFLDSAYCRYDSSSGLCDLIGPGSYVTTPGGGRYDLWQLQCDKRLQVRATFSCTQLRQLYIGENPSAATGLCEGLTLTQNYPNGTLAPTAMLDDHGFQSSGVGLRVKEPDASGSWIAAPWVQALHQTDGPLTLKWSAVAGQRYQVQWSSGSNQLNWNNLGSALIATNDTIIYSDTIGNSNSQRFYHVVRLP